MLKDLEQEDRFWLYIWSVLGTLVTVIIMTLIITRYSYDLRMAELGYEQKPILGSATLIWQKSDK